MHDGHPVVLSVPGVTLAGERRRGSFPGTLLLGFHPSGILSVLLDQLEISFHERMYKDYCEILHVEVCKLNIYLHLMETIKCISTQKLPNSFSKKKK